MTGRPAIRELSSVEECRAAAALVDRVWGGTRLITPELLRAIATHGGLVLGAYLGDELAGAQMGFLGMEDGRPFLHSHVTGVEPAHQRHGIGFALKIAQRERCLARGIELVTWTFDPMIARNARFNLRRLGAVAVRFLRDFYGPMTDPVNAGERTDRLEVRWELNAPRVESALRGQPAVASPDALRVPVPPDYIELRARDAREAAAARDRVAGALEDAMGRGLVAVDLDDDAYVLEPA